MSVSSTRRAAASSDGERARRILEDRNRVLERIASGASLGDVLALLCETCEAADPGVLCSVLLLDGDAGTLHHAAGASLPESWCKMVDGMKIGPNLGSCGAAAHSGERVIAHDVRSDHNWAPYCELAVRAGLRACWSEPIRSSKGKVLGTFAMYYRKPRSPSAQHLEFMATSAHIAGVAIEKHAAEAELERYKNELESLVAARTAALEAANQELRRVLSEIKVLSGMLPICAACKRVRDDSGYWAQIESYIAAHSQAEFTHGICPECAARLYPSRRRDDS